MLSRILRCNQQKKSKDEAYLCSYRISVPAADLQKALDPALWPLRVKVREFIHYARKTPRHQQVGEGQGGYRGVLGQGVNHAQVGVQAAPSQQGNGAGHSNQLQVPSIEVSNMFYCSK